MTSLIQESLVGVVAQIKKGIQVELPKNNSLTMPEINLRFKTEKKLTLKTGGMWFLSASKINDLSQHATKELDLHMKHLKWAENDTIALTHAVDQKLKKDGIPMQTYSFDKNFPGQFYRTPSDFKKSSHYIVRNNFYTNCSDTITFEMLYPIFDIKKENTIAIIKFPTVAGATTLDLLWLYSYCCEKMTVLKHRTDSWLKDSFIVLCEGINKDKVKEVRSKLFEQLGKIDYKTLHDAKFTLHDETIADPGFQHIWTKFITAIHHANYVTHSLLVLSMTDKAQSADNKYQSFLRMLSDPEITKIPDEKIPDFMKITSDVNFKST